MSGIAPPDRQRRELRSARPHQAPLHAVAVQQRPPAARVQRHDVVEIGARKLPVRPGAPRELEQPVLRPRLGRAGRHDLLREDVEGLRRRRRPVEGALANAAQQRGALDELVEGQREDSPARHPREAVARAPDALEERRDRARGADLDDEVHVADVDAELERRRGDEGPQGAGLQPLLGVQPARLREASVVAGHGVLAEQLRQLRRDALGHLARVDEHERRPVLADELGHARVDLLPLLVRADRREGRGGHLDAEVELAERARVDEDAFPAGAHEKPADLVERLLRRRQADALDRPPGEGFEPFERQGEVASALVAHDRVDLVDDHGRDRAQHRAPALAAEQDVERFRRRDEDVRRPADHRGALGGRRVSRADEDADLRHGGIEGANFGQRRLEILLNVVRESAQGRHVQQPCLVGQRVALTSEHVEPREERGERLARAGRRGDQGVPSLADGSPALDLGIRGLAEAGPEPLANRRMEGVESGHGGILNRHPAGSVPVPGAAASRPGGRAGTSM